jgi:flagellar biosynthesis/type III secretory pathway M-ring protein FliF/YscJ
MDTFFVVKIITRSKITKVVAIKFLNTNKYTIKIVNLERRPDRKKKINNMVYILTGLVIVLGAAIGLLFLYISELKRTMIELDKEQHQQNKEMLELMKLQMQHTEILTYLADQDPLIGKKKIIYPTIVGEA